MKYLPNVELKIGTEKIERIGIGCKEESFKFVGIHLDEHLSWNCHLNNLCKKVASSNFALNSVKNFLPLRIRKLVYNSLIRSYIEYGILAYGGSTGKAMNQLKILQKKSIRIIANRENKAHSNPLFGNLEILKLHDLYELNVLSFMHDYNKSRLPISFDNTFVPLSYPNRTNSYKLERIRCKMLGSFPSAIFPKLWNTLNITVKSINGRKMFKNRIIKSKILTYKNFKCLKKKCVSCKNEVAGVPMDTQ